MQPAEQAPASDHLTFTRWLAGVLLRWRLVAVVTAVTLVVAVAATFVIPPVYRARASFVANSSSGSKLQGAAGGSSQLGGIISQLGGSVGGDPSESPNFYIQLFQSRELLTRLAQSRFPNPRTDNPSDSATLLEIMRIKKDDPRLRMEIALKKLAKAISAGFDVKTNLVFLSVDMQWPELSAQVANRLVEMVSKFNRETRVSRARSKRVFLESRQDSAQLLLRAAEERQRFFYEQNRGLITSPSLRAEEARFRREVDVASDLYLNMQQQLEIARLDEINDAALITVIDSSVAPRKAQWPRYGSLLVTALALGLMLGLMLVGSIVVLMDWRERNPESWSDFEHSLGRARSDVRSAIGVRRAG
ncbi:MAG: GNVR domain-containing protein [Gemmatimonadaceae bacterium]|nr:GNVR domain-containing protein [Gemmatimonadaceae bacterium]